MINLNDHIHGAPNFIWKEMFASTTAQRLGLVNYPPRVDENRIISNLEYVAQFAQKARNCFGIPIRVNSGYRGPALNEAVGGSRISFHSHGCALDLSFPAGSKGRLIDLFTYFFDTATYTELIAEDISPYGGWVHFAIQRGRETENQLKYKAVGKSVVRMDYDSIISNIQNAIG